MSREFCNAVGASGETAVAALLSAAGFTVYVPIFSKPEIDFIGEINGKLLRFQVKTMAGSTPVLRFPNFNTGGDSYVGTVDWLAFHSLHHGITAFLKPEEIGARLSLRYDKGDDRQVYRNAKMHYASDYPIDRVIKEAST